jgi:hypothetical protein
MKNTSPTAIMTTLLLLLKPMQKRKKNPHPEDCKDNQQQKSKRQFYKTGIIAK